MSSTAVGGRRKAAILMLALGVDNAAEVLRHLERDEIELLSIEMARTPPMAVEASTDVLEEALETARAHANIISGGLDYAREVLERSLGPDKAADILSRLHGVVDRRPFSFLRRTPPDQIHAYLRNESPQTIALVLASIHKPLAARILEHFDPEEQPEITARLAAMGETSPDVVQAIEEVMRGKLSAVVHELSAPGGVKSVAEILNQVDRPTERNVLERLHEREPELAEQIRSLLFTFEDIMRLDDRNIQAILKDVDQKDLALALKGTGQDVRDRVFANMSERGAEMLREEIEFMPPQRRRAVEEAQGRIVAVVRKLEESGVIVMARPGGEDDLVT